MKRKEKRIQLRSMGYVAPAMLLLIFLLVIPLFYTLYCSLYNLDYLVKGDFVGLGNYVRLLKDIRISKSLLFTFEITIISTLLSVGIGLLLALWVDRAPTSGWRGPGRNRPHSRWATPRSGSFPGCGTSDRS